MPAAFHNSTLRERTYQVLLELILSGELPLGSQIDEQKLANRLSISRTPIREAINMLVKDALVVNYSYRGSFVRNFTKRDVEEVYQVRAALEGLAARLAVGHLTDESLAELEQILVEISKAVHARDIEALSGADRRFHLAIVRMAENQILEAALGRLDWQVQLMRSFANHDPEIVMRTSLERPKIMAALEERDGVRASELLEAHINGVKDSLIGQLKGNWVG